MTPIKHPNETRRIGEPKNWDEERDGPCATLSVSDQRGVGGANVMMSRYKPDHEELDALIAGGSIEFGIYGTEHPVICFAVYGPETAEAKTGEDIVNDALDRNN